MHSLYRFYAADDTLLYVGQSRNPFQRLSGHFADKQMDQVRHIELEWFASPSEAISAEAWAIRREKPLWNVIAPVKPRKVRVTPKAALPVKPRKAPTQSQRILEPQSPMQGPPKPWKHFAIDIFDDEIDGVKIDFAFTGCENGIKRAFKVARRGDVIHMKKGATPIYHTNLMGVTDVPYVQFH